MMNFLKPARLLLRIVLAAPAIVEAVEPILKRKRRASVGKEDPPAAAPMSDGGAHEPST